MTQAEELLTSMSEDEIAPYTANSDTEEHIIIGTDRYITVPTALRRIAVQYDHNIETVTFDCPRYWDGYDMSTMRIYINYLCPNNTYGCYEATDIIVDEFDVNIMHFNWTISQNVTKTPGEIVFLVCVKKADDEGNEELHWNSEQCSDMHVSPGLEYGAEIINAYPDIIAQWEAKILEKVNNALSLAKASGEFDGQDGKSAYQYAVEGGYTGAEEEFAAKLAEEIPAVEALVSLSECGIITPAYQNGTFYTDAYGVIYVL